MPPASTFDPVRYKADTRAEWRGAAGGWRAWAGVLEAADAGLAVSRRLVELARVGPGAAVLDVAAGYGEPGLTAARAAGPAGRVVCADLSGSMLALARERAAAAGLGNVEFVEADAEALDLPEASFDAVVSRQGLQFLPDVPGTLARLRSFLVPGGRLAAAVWGPPALVPFAAPVPVIRAELGLAPPPGGTPGPFALGDRARLQGQIEAAGFREVVTGTATATYRFASPEEATRWLRDVAPPITALVAGQPPEVQERVWARATAAWAPFTDAGGRVRLDNQVLWVTGAR
jgi:SAM-dependent methyltransferase